MSAVSTGPATVDHPIGPLTANALAPAAAPRRTSWWLAIAPLVGVIVPLLVWQAYVKLAGVKQIVLPAPWDVVVGIWDEPRYFFVEHGLPTLWEAFWGFVLGGVVAVALAAVLAHSRFLERAAGPWMVLLQVTPLIAYAPAIVIWRGFGFQSVVTITAICCFVPFLVNAVAGFRSVDPALIELARSVDASRRDVFVHLRIPSAGPHLFAAARISVGMALMGATLGEYFGGVSKGLGYTIKSAQLRSLVLQLWGAVFVLALLGALALAALTALERLVLHWHASHRP